jgi:hypothetical protein
MKTKGPLDNGSSGPFNEVVSLALLLGYEAFESLLLLVILAGIIEVGTLGRGVAVGASLLFFLHVLGLGLTARGGHN